MSDKNIAGTMIAIAQALSGAVELFRLVGDVVNAKKVQDILDSADFPAFARRAAAAGEAARDALDGD